MATAHANGIDIAYECFGDPSGRPLVLVNGLGSQLLSYNEAFCALLAAQGHFVIRFDNRDVGLSTKFDHAGVPDVEAMVAARQRRQSVSAPYLLDDMADDLAGLLDALGLPSAHVVGVSMGGMIVQAFAIRHPGRACTLTSIMSTTGHPDLPPAKPEAAARLTAPPPADREGYIEHYLAGVRVYGSPAHLDPAAVRDLAARAYDRCFYPEGKTRQFAAIVASGSRREALHTVRTPALVIHGAIDPLVPLEAGVDTANAIPGAELVVIAGMGHDLPRPLWPQIVEAITKHTAAVPTPA